ncbi:MAG: hypothetical protein EAZ53_09680 [Bacteroidetes bacterium]|nr:MAG: hypothetical protein EAZ53_09680 [Bacteroidota bacterium]
MKKLTYILCFWGVTIFAQSDLVVNGEKTILEKLIKNAEEKNINGEFRESSNIYNIIATQYWEKKEYENAIKYYEISIGLNEQIGNQNGVTGINSNLAMIYFDTEQFEKSIGYFKKVNDYRKRGEDKFAAVSSSINLAVAHNKVQNYQETIKVMDEALKLAFQVNNYEQIRGCYGLIYETYEKMGNRQKSSEYFDLYKTFNEMARKQTEQKYKKGAEEAQLRASLLEAEAKNKQLLLEVQNREISKKENIINSQSEKIDDITGSLSKTEIALQLIAEKEKLEKAELNQALVAKENSENQAFYTQLFAFLGLLFFVTIGLFVIKNNREKRKNNEALLLKNNEIIEKNISIEKQNTAIKDSINYAKRIQNALLPSEKLIKESFKDLFIIYKPKDIVCGDFYWHKKLETENEIYTVVATVDCTGHGVPGAFMSAIGMNILNKIVNDSCFKPGEILSKLHFEISKSLQNDDVEIRDGMDMSVVLFAKKQQKVWFSGAKNQIIYFQNNELFELKANKEPIGGQTQYADIAFAEHEINCDKNTIFYLFTDGFQDQFGGDENRKFMYKNLKTVLSEIHLLAFEDQKINLENKFLDWKKDRKQTDDVLVLGIKI